MNGYPSIGVDLVILAGGALICLALVLGMRWLVEIIPVTRARRDAMRRSVPVVAALLALLFSVAAVRMMLATRPAYAAVGTTLVLLLFAALAFGPLRDAVSGVVLKAGRVCQQGDHVRIDDLSGRIVEMGLRVLVIETTEGEEAIIPYSRVARDRLVRTSGEEAVTPHVFRVRMPASLTLTATKSLIRQRAMLVHWSVISRQPEVSVTGEGIEVTVYAVDADRGPEIEAEVRRALAEVDPPASPTAKLGSAGRATATTG